jgi:hypothetical protein
MKTNPVQIRRARGAVFKTLGGLGLLAVAAMPAPAASITPLLAGITVNVEIDAPPPPPRHEIVIERDRPGPDFVWVEGFWDGSPGHYVWVAGHWDRPPHGHGHWNAPHWDRDHDGHYHMTRGEWR